MSASDDILRKFSLGITRNRMGAIQTSRLVWKATILKIAFHLPHTMIYINAEKMLVLQAHICHYSIIASRMPCKVRIYLLVLEQLSVYNLPENLESNKRNYSYDYTFQRDATALFIYIARMLIKAAFHLMLTIIARGIISSLLFIKC